jgi:MoaA/NifB/PqqE/SkfB family radical SAM enzyme
VEFGLTPGYAKAMLRQIGRLRPDATVNFTGGEPTLRADLPELIHYAKRAGAARVVLQTNAIRFSRPGYVEQLRDAGLDDALVSLHSSRPHVSDALTGAPGTWAKTTEGIRRALAAGLEITTNVALTTLNTEHLGETIAYIVEELRGVDGVILSPLQPHGNLLHHLELLPRYRDLVVPVRHAARQVRDAGLNLYLSYCENPLCWLLEVFEAEGTPELRAHISRRLSANGCGDCHLSTLMDKDKVKPEPCEGCYFDDVCYGVWREYHGRFGAEELTPVSPPANARPLRRPVSVAPHLSRHEVALSHTALGRRWAGRLRAAATE